MCTARALVLLALGIVFLPGVRCQNVSLVPCQNPDGTAVSGPPTCLAHACVGSTDTECVNDATGVVEMVEVESLVSGPNGAAPSAATHNLFRLYVHLSGQAESIHSIYGDGANTKFLDASGTPNPAYGGALTMPPAKQFLDASGSRGGADIGGANPMFFAMFPDMQYDSFLTIGITGNNQGSLSYTDVNFDTWSEDEQLTVDADAGGAVFWLDPELGASRSDNDGGNEAADGASDRILVGQLAISKDVNHWTAQMCATGRETGFTQAGAPGSYNWETCNIFFEWCPQDSPELCTGNEVAPTPAPSGPEPAPEPCEPLTPADCGPGREVSHCECVTCHAATFNDLSTTLHCTNCPPGHAVVYDGSLHVGCEPCPAYEISDTGTECALCHPGMMPNPDQTRCIANPDYVAPTGEYEVEEHAVVPVVTVTSTQPIASSPGSSWTTYRLALQAPPGSDAYNVYTIFGSTNDQTDSWMSFPAAWQTPGGSDGGFGQDFGGVNEAFLAFDADAGRDSWLTMGTTDGSLYCPSDGPLLHFPANCVGTHCVYDKAVPTTLSAMGLGAHCTPESGESCFSAWSAANWDPGVDGSGGIHVNNAAVYCMDPFAGPYLGAGAAAVIAQLTLDDALGATAAVVNAEGKTLAGAYPEQHTAAELHTWKELNIRFPMGSAPPEPAPAPEPAGPSVHDDATCADSPCLNGGTCADNSAGFTCTCPCDFDSDPTCSTQVICTVHLGDECNDHELRCDESAVPPLTCYRPPALSASSPKYCTQTVGHMEDCSDEKTQRCGDGVDCLDPSASTSSGYNMTGCHSEACCVTNDDIHHTVVDQPPPPPPPPPSNLAGPSPPIPPSPTPSPGASDSGSGGIIAVVLLLAVAGGAYFAHTKGIITLPIGGGGGGDNMDSMYGNSAIKDDQL